MVVRITISLSTWDAATAASATQAVRSYQGSVYIAVSSQAIA